MEDLQKLFKEVYQKQKDVGKIRDFFDSSLEDGLMPKRKIWSYVNEVLDKSWAFSYSTPQGDEGLRMELAQWYLNNKKLANNFMITSGAQEALTIIVQYLNKIINKRVRVGVEEYSYIGFRHILEEHKCGINYLKMTDDGLDLDNFEEKVKKGLDLVYLIPDIQNPTGVVYSKDNREKIVRLQKKYNFWLILDLSYRDLFFNDMDRPGIEMFNHEKTFLVGSFSKTMFPSLRIGWLYLPKINNALLLVRRSIDLFQPTFLQLAMSRYLASDYTKHLKTVRSVVMDKKNILVKRLIEDGFEDLYQWKDVLGGYYLWLRKVGRGSAEQEVNRWSRGGIITASGVFFNPNSGGNYIRLCFSRLNVNNLVNAVDQMSSSTKKKVNWQDFCSEKLINGKIWLKNLKD